MIGGGTAASVSAAAPLATSLPVELSAADRARVDQALRDSRAGNTRAQYRNPSAWRGWAEWSALHGHATLPADPLAIAAYLAERVDQGAAAATVRTLRAAIRAGHVDTGADDPTGHDGVRRVLQGLTRQAAGRGRGQADPLTTDDVAAILATASIPRRTGRGMESEAAAADRGAIDKALVAVLFQGGLRRSEAAALRWADVQDAADGRGIVVCVRRSKTDQDGTAADVRYLKNGCARALRQLHDRLTVQRSGLRPDGTAQVLGGINGQSIARRLTAAASAAGIERRITGHSGRVGLAVELTRRGAPEQATAKAGGWKSSRMVAHCGINGQSIARRLTAAASAAGIEGRITGHSGRVGLAVELTRRGAPEQATAKAGGWKSSRMVAHYSAAVAAEQGAVATYL